MINYYLKHIKSMCQYILPNSFWMAQVAQIDINGSRQFEIIPTIGNHIIEFGDGNDCDKKFNRCWSFTGRLSAKPFQYL
jgi:cell division protein FtsQ